jgi:hypothetical protein
MHLVCLPPLTDYLQQLAKRRRFRGIIPVTVT